MSRKGRRLSPQRLAKLANALGVSTPIPQSTTARNDDSPILSITASVTTRFLLHVIPPAHLPHNNSDLLPQPTPTAPGYHKHFLRGTLLPLHSTLQAQLAAIAREYALPSTAGLILYLINNNPASLSDSQDSDEPGPRLSDDIWKLLWSRVVFAERSPSPLSHSPSPLTPPNHLALRPLACSPAADSPFPPSTPSSIRSNTASAFKSDTVHSEPGTPDTSVDLPPRSVSASRANSLDLPGLSSPSLIPILAKVEFDIDKRKATWYDPWINSRLKKIFHPKAPNQNSDSSTPPFTLLTVKRSELRKKDPLGISPESLALNHPEDIPPLSGPPSPIHPDQEADPHSSEDELDEDATATFTNPNHSNANPRIDEDTNTESYTNANITSDDLRAHDITDENDTRDESDIKDDSTSTEEEAVLEMLEMMSKSRSSSNSSSSLRSRSSSHLSGGRKLVLPPLAINTNTNPNIDTNISSANTNLNAKEEDSYLAYTEPEVDEYLPAVQSQSQGVKREFAVFDDLELELDPTLDIDENDPNDRRKSQILMRAKLDEIERTMAQLSPRTLHSDLSVSFSPSFSPALSASEGGSSLGISPISPNALAPGFLSPRSVSKEFTTSSPPRFGRSEGSNGREAEEGEAKTEDLSGKSWPAIPFSMIKENEESQNHKSPNGPPPLPTLAVNGVSTLPPRAPTRPPPPPPPSLNDVGGTGTTTTTPMTESEKRRRELEEEQGIYNVPVRQDPPLVDGGVIPLSPDPFGRFPSSSMPGHPQVFAIENLSGEREVVMETRARSGTILMNGDAKGIRARSGTMTSKSRFSADSGEEPAAGGTASSKNATTTSNRTTIMSVKTIKKLWRKSKDKDKGVAASSNDGAPPPTPTLASALAAAASSSSNVNDVNDTDKSLPEIPPPPRPERPREEQLDLPDISMQATVPPRLSPSPGLGLTPHQGVNGQSHNGINGDNSASGRRTPQELMQTGRRTPQEQLIPLSSSRPSLDLLNPPTGRRTPQEQSMNPPPSRPSLDQLAPSQGLQHPYAPPQQQSLASESGRRTPQDQFMFPPPRPSLDQLSPVSPVSNHLPPHPHPMQMPMFQGRNPHNGPVTPVLAMHYPSRSVSASSSQSQQADRLDVNKLMFDQESPYPVRFASNVGAGGGAGRMSPVGAGTGVTIASVEPEKPSTMRKSILKSKLTNANGNTHGHSDSSSSSSSSPVGAVPRQSFERFERPGAGSIGHGHLRGVGGGGKRPSVISFGSTSSSASSGSMSSSAVHWGGGGEIPPNPQVPAQYISIASSATSGGGDLRAISSSRTPHVHFKLPNTNIASVQNPNRGPASLSIPNPKELQVHSSRPPSRQSIDSQSHSPVDRRSDASSFDLTQFEFVSPVPAQGR